MKGNYIEEQVENYKKELIELLHYSNVNVPFFKEDCLNINDWNSIPIINKKVLQKYNTKFISNLIDNNYILNTHTSGSTGNSLTLVKDIRLERIRNLDLWKRRNKIVKGLSSKKLLYFYRTLESQKMNAYIYGETEYIDLSKKFFDSQIKTIIQFDPEWVIGPATVVHEFSKHCKKKIKFEEVRYVEVYGEMLKESFIPQIRESFPNAKLINHYGIREVGSIAFSDENPMYLELFNDWVILELVDEENNLITDTNVEGYIVVTSLKDRFMPIIRYKTEDKAILIKNDKIQIKLTEGREMKKFKCNDKIIASSIFDVIFARAEKQFSSSILNYQIIQNSKAEFIINVLLDINANYDVIKFLENKLYLELNTQIKINIVDYLFTENSRKFIRYKSYLDE